MTLFSHYMGSEAGVKLVACGPIVERKMGECLCMPQVLGRACATAAAKCVGVGGRGATVLEVLFVV